MDAISQNMNDKLLLNPITAYSGSLLNDCPAALIDFYQDELPKWEERITETVRQTSWFTDQPNYKISSRDILYFWPFFLGFCWSFDPKFVNLNLLQLAYNSRPEAYILDADFRKKQGEDIEDILKDHWQGAIDLWISQIILENYNRVIGKNYIGKQVSRFILTGLESNSINLKAIVKDNDLEAEVNIEIIKQLGKSARDAVKMTRDYFVRQVLRDNLKSMPSEFIDTFSAEGQILKDAIDGHYHYVELEACKTMKRAAEKASPEILDSQDDSDKPGSDKKFTPNSSVSRDKASPFIFLDAEGFNRGIEAQSRTEYFEIEAQKKGEERQARALGEARAELFLDAMVSQKTKSVMDLYFENPDLTDAKIAENLGITRMTVSKYKDIGFNYVKKIYRITA